MKKRIFTRRRLLTILLCVVMLLISAVIIYSKASKNPLLGEWLHTDGIHTYKFDENILTIGSTINDYKECYGYVLNNNSTITINQNGNIKTVKFKFTRDMLILLSDGETSDISERLVRKLD